MKMKLTPLQTPPRGTTALVERAYLEGCEMQYLREAVTNSLEAGARRVSVDVDWAGVKLHNIFRLLITDDGHGMRPVDLATYLSTIGQGGKLVGGVHENYAMGLRASLLPWNKAGLVIASWTDETPEGAMVTLAYDKKNGTYGTSEVTALTKEYSYLAPAKGAKTGTAILCLGDTGKEHTILGDPRDANKTKSMTRYLNSRFWDVGDIRIQLGYFSRSDIAEWPRTLQSARRADPKVYFNATVQGAKHFVYDVKASRTKDPNKVLEADGVVSLSDGTKVRWALWKDRPGCHQYGEKLGYVGLLYRNELYGLYRDKWAHFGITQQDVRNRLFLIVEPPLYDPQHPKRPGVMPNNTGRTALRMAGGAHGAGRDLSFAAWGEEFRAKMPKAIIAAEREQTAQSMLAVPEIYATKMQKMLEGMFKDNTIWIQQTKGKIRVTPEDQKRLAQRVRTIVDPEADGPSRQRGKKTTRRRVAASSASVVPSKNGKRRGSRVQAFYQPPEVQPAIMGDLDGQHARWTAPSAAHPTGLLQIAEDSDLLLHEAAYWNRRTGLDAETDVIVKRVWEAMAVDLMVKVLLVQGNSATRMKADELLTPEALTVAMAPSIHTHAAIEEMLFPHLKSG